MEQKSSYKEILKATSIFGGVQFLNIIISIARSKLIAILIGPIGMGIAGLFTSTSGIMIGIFSFGLGTSAVKDVAIANDSKDEKSVSRVISIVRKLVWITGVIGSGVTLIFSCYLSKLTFGSDKYAFSFAWLSFTILFSQLTTGSLIVLQGLRKLKFLAIANVIGSAVGLMITAPLYYYWRLDAIVPAIIISSVIALIISLFYSQRVALIKVKVGLKETLREGKGMVVMGILISLADLMTRGSSYALTVFINNLSGVEQVGLYMAGFAIINRYVGLIFTAMGTDYYPRLSAVSHSNDIIRNVINQQAEIAILILAPIIMFFLVYINFLIIVLYSKAFFLIKDMIHWAALGMFFKSTGWAVGFVFLAKGDSKLFFWNEVALNIYQLLFNVCCYLFFGLTGLGIAFVIGNILYLIQVYIISNKKYSFDFSSAFLKLFFVQLLLAILCLLFVKLFNEVYAYTFGSISIILSILFSYRELNKRIDIISILKKSNGKR